MSAAQEAADLRREPGGLNRDAYLPDLATSLNNLAVRLGETSRRAEGLAAAQGAVDLYRELAEVAPEVYEDGPPRPQRAAQPSREPGQARLRRRAGSSAMVARGAMR